MSMFSFRGGPWDGFVIEYGDRAEPDGSVHPHEAGSPDDGHYLLDDVETAYVWTHGSPVPGIA